MVFMCLGLMQTLFFSTLSDKQPTNKQANNANQETKRNNNKTELQKIISHVHIKNKLG